MNLIELPDEIIKDKNERIYFHCKKDGYQIFFIYKYGGNELIVTNSKFEVVMKSVVSTNSGCHLHSCNVHNHFDKRVVFNICQSDIHRELNKEEKQTYYQFYETVWFELNLLTLELKKIATWEKSEIRELKSLETVKGIIWICAKQNPIKEENGNYRIGCPMNFGYSVQCKEELPNFTFTKPFANSIYEFDFVLKDNHILICSVLGSGWDNAYFGRLRIGDEEITQVKLDVKKNALHFFCMPTIVNLPDDRILLIFKTNTQEAPQKRLNLTFSQVMLELKDEDIEVLDIRRITKDKHCVHATINKDKTLTIYYSSGFGTELILKNLTFDLIEECFIESEIQPQKIPKSFIDANNLLIK